MLYPSHVPHGQLVRKYRFSYDDYTRLWNVLDYCATTVPVTKVMAADIPKPQYNCRKTVEAKVWNECKLQYV